MTKSITSVEPNAILQFSQRMMSRAHGGGYSGLPLKLSRRTPDSDMGHRYMVDILDLAFAIGADFGKPPSASKRNTVHLPQSKYGKY